MHVFSQTLASDFPLNTSKSNQILNILIFDGENDTSSALENFLKSNMKFGSVRHTKLQQMVLDHMMYSVLFIIKQNRCYV